MPYKINWIFPCIGSYKFNFHAKAKQSRISNDFFNDPFILEKPSFLHRFASKVTVCLVGLFSRLLVGKSKSMCRLELFLITSSYFCATRRECPWDVENVVSRFQSKPRPWTHWRQFLCLLFSVLKSVIDLQSTSARELDGQTTQPASADHLQPLLVLRRSGYLGLSKTEECVQQQENSLVDGRSRHLLHESNPLAVLHVWEVHTGCEGRGCLSASRGSLHRQA